MSRILIWEPSLTAQAVIRKAVEKAEENEITLEFAKGGLNLMIGAYNSVPDALVIDSRCTNPSAVPLVRLLKNVEKLKSVPVALLSSSQSSIDLSELMSCGIDSFIQLDSLNLAEELSALVAKKGTALALPVESSLVRTSLSNGIFQLVTKLRSLEQIAQEFLNLVVQAANLPAASLYVNTKSGIEAFYITSYNFTEEETADFLKVCSVEFEKNFPDANVLNIQPRRLDGMSARDEFHPEGIPLSAYQTVVFMGEDFMPLGTFHAVKAGTFTTSQTDLIQFAVESLGLIMQNAVMLKEKLKFERNIRKAFSRFVPEQIIDELVESAESESKVGVGEKRDVAILFSDIRSFTSISERNNPETIVAFLNRYFTIMCTIIKKHGGTIDKFIGDAIMALFGAPVSYEDNCRRAVAAAYEMREALPNVPLEDLFLPQGMKFDIGIGIHYGDVTVGSIGSKDKTDYTVIGDSVNLASRLEGLTKTYGAKILVSEAVKEDIKSDEFVFRPLDDVKVKGKTEGVPIYAIDRGIEEFSDLYRDSYRKGLSLYKQGTFTLAKEYFETALSESLEDKACKLMISRCEEFIKNPPENWDGAITFTTK